MFAFRSHLQSFGIARVNVTLFTRSLSKGTTHHASRFVAKRKSALPPLLYTSTSRSIVIAPISLVASPFHQQRRLFSSNPQPPRRGAWGVLASVGAVAVMKLKYVLMALKFLKLGPLVSMVISSAAYTMLFGWTYGLGMFGLIFVHEAGHMIVMRRYGYPFHPAVFIPFMGAVVAMKEPPKNAFEDAMIAFGGPVVGGLAAVATMGAAISADSQVLFALADFGYMINLFNMIPLGSMDGGRVGNAISPYFGLLGLGLGGALIYTGGVSNPIFYLLMITGGISSASRLFGLGEEQLFGPHYYNIGGKKQAGLFLAYVAVVGGLITGMAVNSQYKKSAKQIKFELEHPESASKEPWEAHEDDYFESYFGPEEGHQSRPPIEFSGDDFFKGSGSDQQRKP